MIGALRAFAGFFVMPEPATPRPQGPPRPQVGCPGPARAAVVGGAAQAPLLAAALAGELRVRAGARTAIVLSWRDGGSARRHRAPAAPAAARVAGRLARRGLRAQAYGRVVTVELGRDPREAVAEAEKVWAASDVPTVLALAGARPAAFDSLLADHSPVLIASCGDDERLAALARADLRFVGGDLVDSTPVIAGPSRWLAAAGFGRLPGLDEPRPAVLP